MSASGAPERAAAAREATRCRRPGDAAERVYEIVTERSVETPSAEIARERVAKLKGEL